MSFVSLNPATGKILSTYPEMDLKGAREDLKKSHEAFRLWRTSPFQIRAACMKKAAEKLTAEKHALGELMTQEMGKPILQAYAEIEKCAWLCEYFAEKAEIFLQPELVETDAHKSYIAYEPLGVILAIMPWNFPFWQVFRAAIPALMAGNAMVLKHASNVSGCALAIEKIFKESGLPEELFQTLLVTSTTALSLIESPHVQGVTLTGSLGAGKSVGAQAGKFIKKCVLELGGSDPYVILEDADIEEAASICAKSRLLNSGQSCISAKRFIIVENQFEKFEELFLGEMKKAVLGNPFDEKKTVGPLARIDLRDILHKQVLESMDLGAKCLLGGYIPEGPGSFYPPTLLTRIQKGMPAYEEELFGPVAALIIAQNEPEALQIANDSGYGLGAAVFTQNKQKGEEIALKGLEAGSCFVNAFVKSDPRLPFGGIKESGFGRELSCHGIREFVNCKAVYIM
ncbi:MAG: NAD-dependent succinate-semialdehyde dehydrogenase [Alphaproteobacteria bacterium]|nr:NAD-dependent succinate-semialdehyde dehydrogenase [Alphaproteobacteria bacterium]